MYRPAGGEAPEIGVVEEQMTVCADGPTVKGIDVSYYQGTINWASVKSAGFEFAFIRGRDPGRVPVLPAQPGSYRPGGSLALQDGRAPARRSAPGHRRRGDGRDVAFADRARYQITHDGQVDYVTLNQKATNGFRVLGEFRFAAGGSQKIHLGDNTGEANTKLVFDALRFTRINTGGCGDGVCSTVGSVRSSNPDPDARSISRERRHA
jgi:hypothetical protein